MQDITTDLIAIKRIIKHNEQQIRQLRRNQQISRKTQSTETDSRNRKSEQTYNNKFNQTF